MIIPILQSRNSSLERISDLSKVTQHVGDRDGFRAQEGALKNISLSLFFIAFKNKPWLLNIIIPIIDFKLEPLPEMLNDKYSYYQREHSEKLIASICLMSVCVHTCGEGSDFWFLCNTELPAWAAEGVPAPRGDSEFLRIAWQAHQQIPQGCRTGHSGTGAGPGGSPLP